MRKLVILSLSLMVLTACLLGCDYFKKTHCCAPGLVDPSIKKCLVLNEVMTEAQCKKFGGIPMRGCTGCK